MVKGYSIVTLKQKLTLNIDINVFKFVYASNILTLAIDGKVMASCMPQSLKF